MSHISISIPPHQDQDYHLAGVRDLALPDLHVHPPLHPARCSQPYDLHVSANDHTVMELISLFMLYCALQGHQDIVLPFVYIASYLFFLCSSRVIRT